MKRSITTPLTLLALIACDGEPRASSSLPSNGSARAAPSAGAAGDNGGALDVARPRDAGAEAPGPGEGNGTAEASTGFAIVEVPGGPCQESSAPQRTLLAADAASITFDRAGRVADRYFAFDSASLAFVTFAADGPPGEGALALAPVYADVVALSGDGSGLRALEIGDTGTLVASRFDAQGSRIGASFELDATATTHHALHVAGERALAVWNVAGELRGRPLGADGPEGAAFDFGAASCGDYGCQPFLLGASGRFILVWGRVLHDGTFGISFAAIDPSGAVLSSKPVLASFARYQLLDAALLADESIALLIGEGFPPRGVLLQRLDAFGNIAEPAQRVLGAVEPWALASHGSSLAVVARAAADRAMLRTFSSSKQASEHWTCLDDNLTGTAFAPRAAVFATEAGYGLVVRRTDGSSVYATSAAP
jgi:hypothetical protein